MLTHKKTILLIQDGFFILIMVEQFLLPAAVILFSKYEASTSARKVNSERNDEVWLSSYLPLEDMIANYPPLADDVISVQLHRRRIFVHC